MASLLQTNYYYTSLASDNSLFTENAELLKMSFQNQ